MQLTNDQPNHVSQLQVSPTSDKTITTKSSLRSAAKMTRLKTNAKPSAIIGQGDTRRAKKNLENKI
ncbi:hypothetical protein BDV25DRAFT_147298 [Aspergillus avenaceus]|uniref:Uncharacterized protein n=1 Tax=Aspergillus avenaceus TaxID=36643 RepID=A0A5N6U7X1_ASPAV|nr:hypothetical protein BDV25DRAFT_147298 [Aspergillus avenaceus]